MYLFPVAVFQITSTAAHPCDASKPEVPVQDPQHVIHT